MRLFIAVDSEGRTVGRFKKTNKPDVPDGVEIKEVDDLSEHPIEKSVVWFP